MRRLNRLMEHFWLALFIGTAIWAVWIMAMEGFAAGRRWLWFPLIALMVFVFRRVVRKRLEAMDDRHQQRKG